MGTQDGNFVAADESAADEEEETVRLRRRRRTEEAVVEREEEESSSPGPIAITGQAHSSVEFAIQDLNWFASESAAAAVVAQNGKHNKVGVPPLHLFVTYASDESEYCITFDDLQSFDIVYGHTMKAPCFDSRRTLVQIYARFSGGGGEPDGDGKKKKKATTGIRVPEICRDPFADDSGLESSTKVIEYVFELQCPRRAETETIRTPKY